jgi:hypothetical protein
MSWYLGWGIHALFHIFTGTRHAQVAVTVPEAVYKPNVSDYEVIGISGTTTYSFQADSKTSVIWAHPVGSEWTERADSARLSIRNDSAATRLIYGVSIRGTPVIRLSGKSGFIHDDYVDYEDIGRNGEQQVEIGNNYITSADLTNRVANWWWRNIRAKKHYYQIREPGFCSYYDVGEWYTLTITSTKVWNVEAVNSTVECMEVQSDLRAGDVGETTATFREVYPNWAYDNSAYVARYRAMMKDRRPESQLVTIGAADYIGDADYYCDGASDEVEWNQAIDRVDALLGKTIRGIGGTFYVSAAIVVKSGVKIELDAGSIIQRNGVYPAIEATGTVGTHLFDITLTGYGKICRQSADTSIESLIHCQYVDRLKIENLTIEDAQYDHSIELDYCYNYTVSQTKMPKCLMGVHASYSNGKFSYNMIDGESELVPTTTDIALGFSSSYESDGVNEILYNEIKNIVGNHHVYGIYVSNGGSEVKGNRIDNLVGSGAHIIDGIHIQSADDCDVESNTVQDINNMTVSANGCCIAVGITSKSDRVRVDGNRCQRGSGYGIKIDNTSLYTRVLNNYCYGNGADAAFSNTNTNNFNDGGGSTQIVANTWQ